MLAKSGPLPEDSDWSFELKLDGFRCLVCTHGEIRVRSRRGWDMTELLPELRKLPGGVQLDGELIALSVDGTPDFHRLCSRMLHRQRGIAITYYAFDVLGIDGSKTTAQPYRERRRLLENMHFEGRAWATASAFNDPDALWRVIRERGTWKGSCQSGSRSPTALANEAG